MGEEEGIKQYCKKIISLNIALPMAEYLSDGQWAVASKTYLTFNIICKNQLSFKNDNKTKITKPPIDILTLKMSCTAFSDHITLPPYYHQESNYNISKTLETFLKSYELIEMKMWKPFDNIFPNFTHIKLPEKLKEASSVK